MRLHLQHKHVGYAQNGNAVVIAPAANQQLHVYEMEANNRSGGAINVGLLKKLVNASWEFYQIDASATPDAIDATAAIQAGTAKAIFTTTNDDGFLVQARKPFSLIGFNQSVATVDGAASAAYSYEYYNGTAYVTLNTIAVPTYTGATGNKHIVFNAPNDWAVGTTADVGGDSNLYSVLVRATTAPDTTGGSINSLWVGEFLKFAEGVADNASLELKFDRDLPLLFEGGEGLMPYFSGTASAQNSVRVLYKIQP